jgi:CBS-domain-containing membrane protein
MYDKEVAQPGNIFFGHLLGIIVGILVNEFFGLSFLSLALAVGLTVTLMIYLKVVHPPAAANPLIALLGDVSFEYIFFPVISGSLVIIFFSIIINKLVLKRNYPKKNL